MISTDEYENIWVLSGKIKWHCESCASKNNHIIAKTCDFVEFFDIKRNDLTVNRNYKSYFKYQCWNSRKVNIIILENVQLVEEVGELKDTVNTLSTSIVNTDKINAKVCMKKDIATVVVVAAASSHADVNVSLRQVEVMSKHKSYLTSFTNSNFDWKEINYYRNKDRRWPRRGRTFKGRLTNNQSRESNNYFQDGELRSSTTLGLYLVLIIQRKSVKNPWVMGKLIVELWSVRLRKRFSWYQKG